MQVKTKGAKYYGKYSRITSLSTKNSNSFRRRLFGRGLLLGLVGAHLCLRRARSVRRDARGAATRAADRPSSPAHPISAWVLDDPAGAGIYSFRRPSPDCGDSGMEMGWLWVSNLVHLPRLARNLCLAGGTRRYGDRNN